MDDKNRLTKFAEDFEKSIEEKSLSELEGQLIESKKEYRQLSNEIRIEGKPSLRNVIKNKILNKPLVAKVPDQRKIFRIKHLSIMISKLETKIALLKSEEKKRRR